jgi:hypothetical protein
VPLDSFGATATTHPVEWPADNGSCYTTTETIEQARALGIIPCFTPVRSPESDGMAEAFLKTFKRDYVYLHDRLDARTVLAQLPQWFEDYNEFHPHKGLKIRSPGSSSAVNRQPLGVRPMGGATPPLVRQLNFLRISKTTGYGAAKSHSVHVSVDILVLKRIIARE